MTSKIIPGGGHNKLLTPELLDDLEALNTPRMIAISCYSRRQKVTSYRYIKQYYPNFQRAVARNFLSFFVEIFRLNLLVEVLTTSRQIFVASKNGKFSGTRSFLRPRGADFGQKCPFSGENRQKRLRAASKMTSYRRIFHSLRP